MDPVQYNCGSVFCSEVQSGQNQPNSWHVEIGSWCPGTGFLQALAHGPTLNCWLGLCALWVSFNSHELIITLVILCLHISNISLSSVAPCRMPCSRCTTLWRQKHGREQREAPGQLARPTDSTWPSHVTLHVRPGHGLSRFSDQPEGSRQHTDLGLKLT